MYYLFINRLTIPVFPQSISIKTGNMNKTMTLINEGEINIPKGPGIKEISFELLLPNRSYGFAYYDRGFKPAVYYLERLENIKSSAVPVQLLIARRDNNDRIIYDTDLKVVLEDMTVRDDAREGTDTVVSLRWKEYKNYGVQTYKITKNNTVRKKSSSRDSSTSPAPKKTNKTYTVQKGDCLWNIAKRFYGDGSKYTKIYDANKKTLGGDPNLIYPGTVLVIPV